MKKFIVLLLVCICSCSEVLGIQGGADDFDDTRKVTDAGIAYEFFYVEGMKCVRIGSSLGANGIWSYNGISCDWRFSEFIVSTCPNICESEKDD